MSERDALNQTNQDIERKNQSNDYLSQEIFLTRQPIFDEDKRVWAHELDAGCDRKQCGASVTQRIIHDTLNVIGPDQLVDGKKVFVPVVADTLRDDDYLLLPSARTILSLDLSVAPDGELLRACQEARDAGYSIASSLNETTFTCSELLDIATLVSFDMRTFNREVRTDFTKEVLRRGISLVARNINNYDEFAFVSQFGCHYFHGTFFCQPECLTNRKISTFEAVHIKLLAELNKAQIDFAAVENIIKSDVSLSYDLMKYINSAAIGIRQHVTSIKQTLTLLGERMVRKWGSVVAINSLIRTKPHELFVVSLVRAHMCENLGIALGLEHRSLDLFLLGLLSTLDAIMDVSMEQVIKSISLPIEVRAVLLGNRDSRLGRIYLITEASQRGAWSTVNQIAADMNISQRRVADLYYSAMKWVRQVVN